MVIFHVLHSMEMQQTSKYLSGIILSFCVLIIGCAFPIAYIFAADDLVDGTRDSSNSLIAVVIDNDIHGRQYQKGLATAIVVFEAIVENSSSRLLALYDPNNLPDTVGPIRPFPEEFIHPLAAWLPLVIHSGIEGEIFSALDEEYSLQHFDARKLNENNTNRMPPYPPPYNIFLQKEVLQTLSEISKEGTSQLFSYGENQNDSGTPIGKGKISFPQYEYDVSFSYDEDGQQIKHAVIETQSEVQPTNFVTYTVAPNSPLPEGPLFLFQEGIKYDGRWFYSAGKGMRLLSPTGAPLLLKDGQLWMIEVEKLSQVQWGKPLEHHLKDSEVIVTSDHTPLLISQLSPDSMYDVTVWNENKELLMRTTDRSDSAGVLIYGLDKSLPTGTYHVVVRDGYGKEAQSYTMRVLPSGASPTLWVLAFGMKEDSFFRSKGEREYFVGGIERSPNQVIQGYILPNEEIYAYFHSETVIETATADERGYFEIPIPIEIGLGEHSVRLVHKPEKGVFSEDVIFSFALLPGAYEALNYDVSHGLTLGKGFSYLSVAILILFLQLLLVFYSHVRWGLFVWLRPVLSPVANRIHVFERRLVQSIRK